MKYSVSVLIGWAERCSNEGRNLTQWELQFIDSIYDQLISVGSLSQKQEEILERIYTTKVP